MSHPLNDPSFQEGVEQLRESLGIKRPTAGDRIGQVLASVVALLGISAVTITYIGFLVWFWNLTMGWAT